VTAMSAKTLPIVVLLAAVTGLVGSAVWAVNRESAHGAGWMRTSSAAWMMGYRGGAAAPVRSLADARTRAQAFAGRLGLKVAEVIQFTDNFYARLDDKSGKPATEVLVDPATGTTSLEYGPAMMWNTRYGVMTGRTRGGMIGSGAMGGGSGMMGSGAGMMSGEGMMGSGGGTTWMPPSGTISGPLSARQAIELAKRWLAQRDSSLTVPDADAFPGYFTMETVRNGTIVGMMSVNASTGAIWDHWWHGRFVAISE